MKNIKVGSKVRLTEDIEMTGYRTFEKGHIFTVYGSSYRGWDLIDDKGFKLDETLFIHDRLEFFDIKEERKEKLIKISNDGQS